MDVTKEVLRSHLKKSIKAAEEEQEECIATCKFHEWFILEEEIRCMQKELNFLKN